MALKKEITASDVVKAVETVGVRYIINRIRKVDIAEIIGFLQSEEIKIPIDKRVHPSKKKPKTVLTQVVNEIFPKMHSTSGIINILIQERNKTVTEEKNFPNAIFIGFIGSENSSLSVFCLYSSEKDFIVSIGMDIKNRKLRL